MLVLPIKKKWYDMILSGEKKEEYREIKPYYDIRFLNALNYMSKNLTNEKAIKSMKMILNYGFSEEFEVIFKNGYGKESPQTKALCRLSIDSGKPEWGAEPEKHYYVLHIIKLYK